MANNDKCEFHEEKIGKLEDAVFGNGREGLVTYTAKISVYVKIIIGMLTPILVGMIVMLLKVFAV